MGFDQNDDRPLFFWRKWTTEINLATVVGVVIFMIIGYFLIYFLWSRKNDTTESSSSAVSTVEQLAPLVVFRGPTAGGSGIRATPFFLVSVNQAWAKRAPVLALGTTS